MVKVITVGLQKGGVGKTTTAGVLCYLLAKDGNKVLAVDMDSQGNLSDLLGNSDNYYQGWSIIEAFEDMDTTGCIHNVGKNLDLLPANDFLAMFAKWLYTKSDYRNKTNRALKDLLAPIKNNYDYIVIDTPPSLAEPMINAVSASDFIIVLSEGSKWAFDAIPRFVETIETGKEYADQEISILGILRTLNDVRRADSKVFVEVIGETYPELVFDTVIKRKAATGRISFEGLFDNKELKQALDQYQQFYKEVLQRVQTTK